MNRTSSSISPEEEAQLLEQLRQVLLSEDREALSAIREVLEDEALLSEKVSPIIRQHLAFIKENFQEEYGTIIEEIVSKKLSESQDEIVNMIFPKLNTIIKKFITAQFQILKEGIDTQIKTVQNRFSPKQLFNRFFGPSDSDQYENYKIFLHNLPSYYFAVAMTGSISTSEKENLSNKLITFAKENVPFDTTNVNSTLTDRISTALSKYFIHFNIQE